LGEATVRISPELALAKSNRPQRARVAIEMTKAERKKARASWPGSTGLLGDETPPDASSLSMAERVEEVFRLSSQLWAFSGRPFPQYKRSQMPGRLKKLGDE
jgi:hypothetical protein